MMVMVTMVIVIMGTTQTVLYIAPVLNIHLSLRVSRQLSLEKRYTEEIQSLRENET